MATRRRLALLGIIALAMLCWLALALWPAGRLFVCGAAGIAEIIPAWSADRAVSLLAMWTMMSAAMLLPCAAVDIVRTGVTLDRVIEASFVRAFALAIAIAPARWTLESLGAMSNGPLPGGVAAQLLLVVIAAGAAAIHLVSGARWAGLVVMLALQVAGGAMNLGWMAVISAGMLALAIGRATVFLPLGQRPTASQ